MKCHSCLTRARVIAATNINLRERVEQGLFREDAYYRLNILSISFASTPSE